MTQSVCVSLTITADPRVSEYVSGNFPPQTCVRIKLNVCRQLSFVYSYVKLFLLLNALQAKIPSGRTSHSSLHPMPTPSATEGCLSRELGTESLWASSSVIR